MDKSTQKVAAITIKGLGYDDNGLNQYIWATQTQLKRLLECQFDEERRNFVFMIGDRGVKPSDVITFKIVDVATAEKWPSFRKYVLNELEKEDQALLKERGAKVNKVGLERLKQLKARHNL